MYKCGNCYGTFYRFEEPGRCPLCKQYASVRCTACQYTAHSSAFTNNGDRCPNCGAKVAIPGGGDVKVDPKAAAGCIVAVALSAMAILIVAGIIESLDRRQSGQDPPGQRNSGSLSPPPSVARPRTINAPAPTTSRLPTRVEEEGANLSRDAVKEQNATSLDPELVRLRIRAEEARRTAVDLDAQTYVTDSFARAEELFKAAEDPSLNFARRSESYKLTSQAFEDVAKTTRRRVAELTAQMEKQKRRAELARATCHDEGADVYANDRWTATEGIFKLAEDPTMGLEFRSQLYTDAAELYWNVRAQGRSRATEQASRLETARARAQSAGAARRLAASFESAESLYLQIGNFTGSAGDKKSLTDQAIQLYGQTVDEFDAAKQ